MRILLVDDSAPSFVMYPQTDSFVRALSQRCEVTVVAVDTTRERHDLREHSGYDLVLVWQSVTSHRHKDLVRVFQLPSGALRAAVVSDFFHPHLPRSPVVYNPYLTRSLQESVFDIVFTTYYNVYEWSLLLPDAQVVYMPYCVDPDFFCDLEEPRLDSLLVCCSTNNYLYPFRTRVIDLLHNQSAIPCRFRVNANDQWGNLPTQLGQPADTRRSEAYSVLKEYRRLVNAHRFFLATTSIGPGVELKFAEAVLCGACVVCDLPERLHERYRDTVALIHSCMTDGDILGIIEAALRTPTTLVEQRGRARDLVVRDFGPDTCVDVLLEAVAGRG